MKNRLYRLLLLTVITILIALFYRWDGHRYLQLDQLKYYYQQWLVYYHLQPFFCTIIYFIIYILVTALSLPGATIMTLAGGALFGPLVGTLLVSFASSIGASFAFLSSRFIFQQWVEQRMKSMMDSINLGLKKEGDFYLFALRLIPLFPFFAINLCFGLTRIPLWRFYLISQLGMLPGTFVYVFAGGQLASIEKIADIASPPLILTFALLGVFPLLIKKMITYYQRCHSLKRYARPSRFDYHLVVIGAGAAGLVSAYMARIYRAKVALIEKKLMGGDCLNSGCVPSKALISSARLAYKIRTSREKGLLIDELKVDFKAVMNNVRRAIRQVAPHDSIERYQALGVDCIEGEAQLISPYQVKVNDRIINCRKIVLATGAKPVMPKIAGIELVSPLTSDTIWSLQELPKVFLVIGGGPVGLELAQAFSRLGSKVTLMHRGERLLKTVDPEISTLIDQQFQSEGIQVLYNSTPLRFKNVGGIKSVICIYQGKEVELVFDQILIALGRRSDFNQLEIAKRDDQTIETDDYLETSIPGIFAAGDCTGPLQQTHFAAHQAWYATTNALFGWIKKFRVDHSIVPWAVFITPEVASVGINENKAKELALEYEVTCYSLEDLDRAICEGNNHGLIRVITARGSDKILGVTIFAEGASDLILEFVSVMKCKKGLNTILKTIHLYPSMGEANKYVAGIWRRKHIPGWVGNCLEKYFTSLK